jgi:hypothetical protein
VSDRIISKVAKLPVGHARMTRAIQQLGEVDHRDEMEQKVEEGGDSEKVDRGNGGRDE